MMTTTDKHARFCAMAGPRTALWRPALGAVLSAAVLTALVAAVGGIVYTLILPMMESRQLGSGYQLVFRATALWGEIQTGTTARGMILQLLMVVAVIVPSLRLTLRLFHQRPLRSLFGPALRLNARQTATGAVVVFLGLSIWPMDYINFGVVMAQPVWDWLVWLPLALPVIFLQSMAEEMAFRGYLQQQLGALSKNAFVWMIIPSVLFGLMHYNPDAPAALNWIRVGVLSCMGAAAALLTAHTGNLGAAVGMHFGNNLAGLLLFGPGQGADGLLLLRWAELPRADLGITSLFSHLIIVVVLVEGYLLISRRRL